MMMPALCALLLMVTVSIPAIASPPEERSSAGDCADRRFYWKDNGRLWINLRHVFCGELRHGRPKGLHSTQLVATSRLIRRIEHQSDEGGGIYSAIVEFSGGKRKLSTFFPDHCSVDQLIRSIEHAATNVRQRHPAWGEIGPSGPAAGLETFCLDNQGAPFDIRLGVLANGRINTAFPN
jgi:hypothetical protein